MASDADALLAELSATESIDSPLDYLSGYAVPKELWYAHPTRRMKEHAHTVRWPSDISKRTLNAFGDSRIAYVVAPNWRDDGVRGMMLISHWKRTNFGLGWLIGSLVSPSLGAAEPSNIGKSATEFAPLARNATWMSAAVGRFDPTTGELAIFYNDDGNSHIITLPFDALITHIKQESTAHQSAQEQRFLGKPATAETPVAPPEPINATFAGIDMTRFWPQVMMALDIALLPPVGEDTLATQLYNHDHEGWSILDTYLKAHHGQFAYVAPRYHSSADTKWHTLGKYTRPDYAAE